jgi:hypothetical protein
MLRGMLLISGTLLASACGPQLEPTEETSSTQAALEGEASEDKQPKCRLRPGAYYVSQDPVECLTITFTCNAGEEQFFNDCGCGCTPTR